MVPSVSGPASGVLVGGNRRRRSAARGMLSCSLAHAPRPPSECLGCVTPSPLHALASVREPEGWLSRLARRPGLPQRTPPGRRCRGSLWEKPTDAEFPHPTRRASDHMTVGASAAVGGHTTAL